MRSIELLALTPDVVAALADDSTFELTYHVNLDQNIALVRSVVAQGERFRLTTGSDARWGGFLAVECGTRKVVGTCAFTGAPGVEGRVEIAYFTFPANERQGFGTAMARALCAEAERRPEVRVITALTLPEDNPSTRILQGLGFTRTGTTMDPDAGTVWQWERSVAVPAAGGVAKMSQ